VILNESYTQANTTFLNNGLSMLQKVTKWKDVSLNVSLQGSASKPDYLIKASMESYRDAENNVRPGLTVTVILEIDLNHHGNTAYTRESEFKKNYSNFAIGKDNARVLMIRVVPGAQGDPSRRCWLIVRDWIVTFLRAESGTWPSDEVSNRTLLYLNYPETSNLIHRYSEDTDLELENRVPFRTIVTDLPPGLPPRPEGEAASAGPSSKRSRVSSKRSKVDKSGAGPSSSAAAEASPSPALFPADWACSLDPFLLCKGSDLARQCLTLTPENRPYHG
jgi:hypothetical protein